VQIETAHGPQTLRRCLSLKGLKSVDAETAQAIAGYSIGPVFLDGLPTISEEAAKDLAAVESWDGHLVSLTAFSAPDSVARALATRTGSLVLPSLKKICPKTLSALIEKQDVDIPLLDSLELISEPDGSTTEDFIIPEWLEERQRLKRAGQPVN